MSLRTTLTEILSAALSSPAGVIITTSNPDKLRRHIYTFRRQLSDTGDTSFSSLSITVPENTTNEVWVLPTSLLESSRGK